MTLKKHILHSIWLCLVWRSCNDPGSQVKFRWNKVLIALD